ncbi:MAG: glyoxylate/hydroxypyruvate reductase A [Castellaniella sp.]
MNRATPALEILFHAGRTEAVDQWIGFLRDEGLEFTPVFREEGQGPTGARIALVWHPPAYLFSGENRLEVVFNVGAGVDAILAEGLLPPQVTLVRLEDAGMGAKMAEYVVHALAEITRDMGHFRKAQQERQWSPLAHSYVDEWPVGILGLGVIGTQIASGVAALGYPVRGWSRRQRHLEGVECHAGAEGLTRFLARTRILVNVLPLTPDTHHILDRDLFRQLLPQAHIINIGRGDHLNEPALLACLADGTLAGATLDVFTEEPLAPDDPLWTHPGVTVTPHISGTTNPRLAMQQIAAKLRAWRAGTPISGIVDRRAGY